MSAEHAVSKELQVSLWRCVRCRVQSIIKEIMWNLYIYVYCRYIYRHHMRLIHPRWHWWTKQWNVMGGPKMDVCEWCGEKRIYCERVKSDGPLKM